jgi:hypothetical protein
MFGLKGEVTVDIREATPAFADRTHVVRITTDECELKVSEWLKLVEKVNSLLVEHGIPTERVADGS